MTKAFSLACGRVRCGWTGFLPTRSTRSGWSLTMPTVLPRLWMSFPRTSQELMVRTEGQTWQTGLGRSKLRRLFSYSCVIMYLSHWPVDSYPKVWVFKLAEKSSCALCWVFLCHLKFENRIASVIFFHLLFFSVVLFICIVNSFSGPVFLLTSLLQLHFILY